MTTDIKSGSSSTGPAQGPGPAAKDPVTTAAERVAAAQAALKQVQQDFTKARAAITTAKSAVDRLAEQKKQVDAQYEAAKAANDEAAGRLEALESLKAYSEVDVAIATLEHELRIAEDEAADPGANPAAAAAAIAAAKERLDKEKEWRGYEDLKRAAGAAQATLELAELDKRRQARLAVLDQTLADLTGQLKKMQTDRAALDEKSKLMAKDLVDLAKKIEETNTERRALA
jgi:chromosome segregation ATPase